MSLLIDQARNPDAGAIHSILDGELGGPGLPLSVSSGAYVTNLPVKAGRGILFGITGYNSNASDQFVQVFDAFALPANGAAPAVLIKASGASNFYAYWGSVGRFFRNGIIVCNSTTGATLTIGAADCFFDVQYL